MTRTEPIYSYQSCVAIVWLSAIVLISAWVFSSGPADDSYIVARYAHNLHARLGPIFNVGERINALTSPIQLLVFYLLTFVLPDPVPGYQVIATIALIVSTTTVAFARLGDTSMRVLFLALALASPFVTFWLVGGLETPVLYIGALFLVSLILGDHADSRGRARTATIVGTLMVMTRYDACLLAAPVIVPLIYRWRRDPGTVAVFILCAVVFASWLLFCKDYYGDFLPTSYYVKLSDVAITREAARGLAYQGSFLTLSLAVFAFPTTRKALLRIAHDPPIFGAWVGVLLSLVYGIAAGTVHMMYAYRFFVPLIPVLFLLKFGIRGSADNTNTVTWNQVFAVLSLQSVLAFTMYWYSQNFNLSLLVRHQTPANESFEFSTIGARNTGRVLQVIRLQAANVIRDWNTLPEHSLRVPRINVDAGGLLPFLLPNAYVYEKLVSFRHYCKTSLNAGADYQQVFRSQSELSLIHISE